MKKPIVCRGLEKGLKLMEELNHVYGKVIITSTQILL